MKQRILIGWAVLFLICGTMGLFYVAYHTSPKQNDIWRDIRFHNDTVFLTAPPQPVNPKQDSCGKAIRQKWVADSIRKADRKQHRIQIPYNQ